MVHEAFKVIGKRISLIYTSNRKKEGIFQESSYFQTIAEGFLRPALDFIEPLYDVDPIV